MVPSGAPPLSHHDAEVESEGLDCDIWLKNPETRLIGVPKMRLFCRTCLETRDAARDGRFGQAGGERCVLRTSHDVFRSL